MTMIPKYYSIEINKRGKFDFSDNEIEYFQREGFKEDFLKNKLEESIRNEIWRYINENDIKITIE